MIFEFSGSPETADMLARLLGAKKKRARTPNDYLSAQSNQEDYAYAVAIDGSPCPKSCGGMDGAVLVVANNLVDDVAIPPSHRIMLIAFDHDAGTTATTFSSEQAKQFVNRLGEAIAVAERIDAEGTVAK